MKNRKNSITNIINLKLSLDELKKDKVKYKKKASKNQKQQIFNKIVGILSGVSTVTGCYFNINSIG